jgi:integrase
MGAREMEAFLTDLAVTCPVSAATQNQALAALLFLYWETLGVELPWLDNVVRARKPRRLPTDLSRDEVRALLAKLPGGPLAGGKLAVRQWTAAPRMPAIALQGRGSSRSPAYGA